MPAICLSQDSSHDHLDFYELCLSTPPCTTDKRLLLFHIRTHIRPPPQPLVQRAADLPPPSSSEAPVRRIVFGRFEVQCDYHPDCVRVGGHVSRYHIHPFGHYFTPPVADFPMNRKYPMK